MALASKLRVVHFEDTAAGGLQVLQRSRALETALSNSCLLVRKARWGEWYSHSALLRLRAADQQFRHRGLSRASIEDRAAGHSPRPWTVAVALRIRRSFQRTARAAWAERQPLIVPEERLRHKLDLRGFHDRRQMVRCLGRLRYMAQQAPLGWLLRLLAASGTDGLQRADYNAGVLFVSSGAAEVRTPLSIIAPAEYPGSSA